MNQLIIPKHIGADVATLRSKQNEIIKSSQRQNTLRAYKSDFSKVNQFLKNHSGKDFCSMDDFTIITPLNSQLLADYITSRTEPHENSKGQSVERESYSTIQRAVFAVSKLHKLNNLTSPYTEQVKQYLKMVKSYVNDIEKQAEAITFDMIQDVCNDIDLLLKNVESPKAYKDASRLNLLYSTSCKGNKKIIDRSAQLIRDKAILLIGFFGCLRRSEIVNIDFIKHQDSKAFLKEASQGYEIVILKTKHHYSGEPIIKPIRKSRKSNSSVCPVAALNNWISISQVCTGKLFVNIGKSGAINCHKSLSGQAVNDIVSKYYGPSFSGHSLRVGFASSAKRSGASIDDIRAMGGWKSDTMPVRYTKSVTNWERGILSVFDY